jgi:hypothetical protein
MQTLSASVVKQDFPAGTVDPGYTFTVEGTLADGTAFSTTSSGTSPSATFDLAPGTYTGIVSKLKVSSLPSAPLTVTAPVTVTLEVPDATAAAAFV